LAEEACFIEIDILKNPIGKQDQYAAAFGGINHIKFNKNGRVDIDPIVLKGVINKPLNESLFLIWTGIKRDASNILSKQVDKIHLNKDKYEVFKELTQNFKKLIIDDDNDIMVKLGILLNESWNSKRNLEESISNIDIDNLFELIMEYGGYGGKLCGAGGGGFIAALISGSNANILKEHVGSKNIFNVNIEPLGSRIENMKFN
jgi:D-glycero-alpha-D-manno-heptose-7-phosphate kinase